jgi:hypothetical protein
MQNFKSYFINRVLTTVILGVLVALSGATAYYNRGTESLVVFIMISSLAFVYFIDFSRKAIMLAEHRDHKFKIKKGKCHTKFHRLPMTSILTAGGSTLHLNVEIPKNKESLILFGEKYQDDFGDVARVKLTLTYYENQIYHLSVVKTTKDGGIRKTFECLEIPDGDNLILNLYVYKTARSLYFENEDTGEDVVIYTKDRNEDIEPAMILPSVASPSKETLEILIEKHI